MTASPLPPGDIPPLTLGVRLWVSLQHSKKTRDDVAGHIGVNPATVSRWMHDSWVRPPSRGNLLAWAAFCGVNAEWLIDGTGQMPTPPTFPHLVTGSDSAASKRPSKRATRRATSEHGLELLLPGRMALSSAAA